MQAQTTLSYQTSWFEDSRKMVVEAEMKTLDVSKRYDKYALRSSLVDR